MLLRLAIIATLGLASALRPTPTHLASAHSQPALSRRALLPALAAAATVRPSPALAADALEQHTTGSYQVTFGAPAGWPVSEQELQGSRYLYIATDPAEPDSANVVLTFQPLAADYTSLGSFGTQQLVGNSLMPQCADRSGGGCTLEGYGIEGKMLGTDTLKGAPATGPTCTLAPAPAPTLSESRCLHLRLHDSADRKGAAPPSHAVRGSDRGGPRAPAGHADGAMLRVEIRRAQADVPKGSRVLLDIAQVGACISCRMRGWGMGPCGGVAVGERGPERGVAYACLSVSAGIALRKLKTRITPPYTAPHPPPLAARRPRACMQPPVVLPAARAAMRSPGPVGRG